jgi:NDP-sugar pyrophosphorylase family protein
MFHVDRIKTKNLLDVSRTICSDFFDTDGFPWEIIPKIEDFIVKLGKNLPKEFSEISEHVWAASGAVISSKSSVAAPAIIESGVQIKFGAFLRGNTVVGKDAVVGNSTELKNCILFEGAQAPHFNYVGDAVLGFKSHIGAGVIISNLKSDKNSIKIRFGENIIDTNMKKFGAVLGDFTEIGCNAVLNPGTIIGRGSTVYPLTMVRGVVESGCILKNNGELVEKH